MRDYYDLPVIPAEQGRAMCFPRPLDLLGSLSDLWVYDLLS